MKKIHLIVITLLAILISVIPFFIYAKLFKGDFSITNSDWGNFGSFIGGTTSALLSTLSLIILIFSLHITIKNFREQIQDQHDNHMAQLKLQREIHSEQTELQNRIHSEQLQSQQEIHEKESDYTIFSTNMSILNIHIENLNRHFDSKIYNYYRAGLASSIQLTEDEFLKQIKSDLDIKLGRKTAPHMRDTHELIIESKVSYSEELIALMNIIGIICNATDKINYVSIFLASIKQERTYWLICYAYELYEPMRERINELISMLVIPQEIKRILRKHRVLA